MHVIVHIGTHKTGTTSLQAFLRQHARQLSAAGVHVPVAGTLDPLSGHHNLAFELYGDSRFDPAAGTWDSLLQELSARAEPRAIVSSEAFEYLVARPEALCRLEELLTAAGHTVEYWVVFRRPGSHAVSLYGTLLGLGLRQRFPVFVARLLWAGRVVMRGRWVFEFRRQRFISAWRAGSSGRLRIWHHENLAAQQGLLVHVLEQLHCSGPLLEAAALAPRLNPGLQPHQRWDRRLGAWLIDLRFSHA